MFLVEETVGFDSERTLIRNLAFMTGLTTALRNVLPSMGANASEYGLLVSSWPGYYQNASRRRDILLRAIREAKELVSLSGHSIGLRDSQYLASPRKANINRKKPLSLS